MPLGGCRGADWCTVQISIVCCHWHSVFFCWCYIDRSLKGSLSHLWRGGSHAWHGLPSIDEKTGESRGHAEKRWPSGAHVQRHIPRGRAASGTGDPRTGLPLSGCRSCRRGQHRHWPDHLQRRQPRKARKTAQHSQWEYVTLNFVMLGEA